MKFYNNTKEFYNDIVSMVNKYRNNHNFYSNSIEDSCEIVDKAIEEIINVNNGIAIKEV